MDTILIVGVDSVVGANLAVTLSDDYHVIGLYNQVHVEFAHGESIACPNLEPSSVRAHIADLKPQKIVYCGNGSQSSWHDGPLPLTHSQEMSAVRGWSDLARTIGSQFTLISTDAVFTGPWMFHEETSTCLCPSKEAEQARSAEALAMRRCPGALVVRTNAYGWAPMGVPGRWLEDLVHRLEIGTAGAFDYRRYSTPILASDLAALLVCAWQDRTEGLLHICGAERINPNRFVERLANVFSVCGPEPVDGNICVERPTGFGKGETSLQTRLAQQTLGQPMPMVDDGLARLYQQKTDGYRERFSTEEEQVAVRAA